MTPLTAIILEPGELYHDRRVYRLSRVPNTHLGVKCQACEFVVHVPEHHGRDRAEQIRRDHLKYAHCTELISGQVVFSEVARAADVLGNPAGASPSAARGTAERSSDGLRRAPAKPSQSRQSGRRSTRAG